MIWVICDASASGVGALYGQGPGWNTCRPAGFMSKKFCDAQFNYCVFEMETLAILKALLVTVCNLGSEE
jgi:RNase H-like domain found in reverse transcriptase